MDDGDKWIHFFGLDSDKEKHLIRIVLQYLLSSPLTIMPLPAIIHDVLTEKLKHVIHTHLRIYYSLKYTRVMLQINLKSLSSTKLGGVLPFSWGKHARIPFRKHYRFS